MSYQGASEYVGELKARIAALEAERDVLLENHRMVAVLLDHAAKHWPPAYRKMLEPLRGFIDNALARNQPGVE